MLNFYCKRLFAFFYFTAIFMMCLMSLPASSFAGEDVPAFNNEIPPGCIQIRAATGILPIKYIVDRIGGEYVETIALLPPGFDPHTYEPKASQLMGLDQADVYFNVNTPFEKAWISRFTTVNPRMKVVDLTSGLPAFTRKEITEHNAEDKTHDNMDSVAEESATQEENVSIVPSHDEHDPHVWLSPALLKIIAKTVCDEFTAMMPCYQLYFEKNLMAFENQLDELDAEIVAEVKKLPENRKTFLVFHPSWDYFARQYGLNQVAVELDGKEPSPAALAVLIQNAKDTGISVVFAQKEFNPAMASTVASQLTGGSVVTLDPLRYDCIATIKEAAQAIINANSSK